MITIGIDSVKIERFIPWTSFSHKKLSRLYSDEEIAYSLSVPTKAAERFAVRFAAKEAFYKAVVTRLPDHKPFITIAKYCSISFGERNNPVLTIQWDLIKVSPPSTQVSLTHTQTTATAIVTLDNR